MITLGVALGLSANAVAQGAKKQILVGPSAVISCKTVEPSFWDNGSVVQDGFVIFNYADGSNKLMATVKLKGASPNTEYPVRLIQGNSGDCHTFDGILTTNKKGNGVLHIDEDGYGEVAQVIIDTGSQYGTPTWRGTDIFYY